MSETERTEIDGNAVLTSILIKRLGLKDYKYIIENYNKVIVSEDEQFQIRFNRFYGIDRMWVGEWSHKYYQIFEKMKDVAIRKSETVSYENILREITAIDGRVAASFASKMLATIDPDMPILDSHVLAALHLTRKEGDQEKRLIDAVEVYDKIVSWYRRYMGTDNAIRNIELFNRYLPNYAWISDVKKIDYMLWADGNKES